MGIKKILLFLLLISLISSFAFCEEENIEQVEEDKGTIELAMEVAELKFELYKIEKRLGEYKEEDEFSLSFEKAKKEGLLRKRNNELLRSVDDDKEKAKNAVDKAMDSLKKIKDKSLDFLTYIKEYFEEPEE